MTAISIFLAGDVMLGRGIDQLQDVACDPNLGPDAIVTSLDYIKLAEERKGKIPEKRDKDYVWGDALEIIEDKNPDARIVNLETPVTTSDEAWPKKMVRYRMHPDNVALLKEAEIECCTLSNNHIFDWGQEGMKETVTCLKRADIKTAGVGNNLDEAKAPGVVCIPGYGRVLVFAAAHASSGVPKVWGAEHDKHGVHLIDFIEPEKTASDLNSHIEKFKRPGDKIVVSLHWGDNYCWDVKEMHQTFAHCLLDAGIVDIIHGHSSHHAKGIEIYNKKLIIYGCGDFINDCEGIISKYDEEFRDDLSLMYFVDVDHKTGNFISMDIVPLEIRHMSLETPDDDDIEWLYERLKRESEKFGVKVTMDDDEFSVTTDN